MQGKYTTPRPCGYCGELFNPPRGKDFAKYCSKRCKDGSARRPITFDWFMSQLDVTTSCWLWRGRLTPQGYGVFKRDGHIIQAHRRALEYAMGSPIPPGFFALHTCDVPACVRFDDVGTYEVNGVYFPRWGHLWLGTKADNNADRVQKCRTVLGNQHWTRQQPEKVARGERHPRAKLRQHDVDHIRERLSSGESRRLLAAAFGVSYNTIAVIDRGETWIAS